MRAEIVVDASREGNAAAWRFPPARTIADLAGSETVVAKNVAEVVPYRCFDSNG